MTALQLIGAMLLALPFVVVGICMAREGGWHKVVFVYGLTIVITAVITLGGYLVFGP